MSTESLVREPAQHPEPPRVAARPPACARPGLARQAFVIIFLVAVVALGLRTLSLGDARFGWGMFSHNVMYTVHYEWMLAGGDTRAYVPGDELRGRATRLSVRATAPWVPRNMLYGEETLRTWVASYLRYLYAHVRPDDAVAVQARIRMAVNPRARAAATGASRATETLRYPRPDTPTATNGAPS